MGTSGIAWPTAAPANGYAGFAQLYDIEDGPDSHGNQLLVWTLIEPDKHDPDAETVLTVVLTMAGIEACSPPLFSGSARSHESALAACGYELAGAEIAA